MKKVEFKTSKGDFKILDMECPDAVRHAIDIQSLPEQWVGVKIDEITESQAKEVVDVVGHLFVGYSKNVYKDYTEGKKHLSLAVYSLHSLMTTLNVHFYVNPLGKFITPESEFSFQEWEAAGRKTFYNPYLFKKHDIERPSDWEHSRSFRI